MKFKKTLLLIISILLISSCSNNENNNDINENENKIIYPTQEHLDYDKIPYPDKVEYLNMPYTYFDFITTDDQNEHVNDKTSEEASKLDALQKDMTILQNSKRYFYNHKIARVSLARYDNISARNGVFKKVSYLYDNVELNLINNYGFKTCTINSFTKPRHKDLYFLEPQAIYDGNSTGDRIVNYFKLNSIGATYYTCDEKGNYDSSTPYPSINKINYSIEFIFEDGVVETMYIFMYTYGNKYSNYLTYVIDDLYIFSNVHSFIKFPKSKIEKSGENIESFLNNLINK